MPVWSSHRNQLHLNAFCEIILQNMIDTKELTKGLRNEIADSSEIYPLKRTQISVSN